MSLTSHPITTCIFDLDGVLVDTVPYHYAAWAELAHSLGFEFTPEQGEATKGLSRMDSLEIVLRAGGMEGRFSEAEKVRMATAKNDRYREMIDRMTPDEVLPGVFTLLRDLRTHGIKCVLGSVSKNAGVILERCALRPWMDAVVDGTLITRAKPDPEVFLKGAEAVGEQPARCVVFEDAAAGIEAARRAGMRTVGVGKSDALHAATIRVETLEGMTFERLIELLKIND